MTEPAKDDRLADLAERHNIAQFVSFTPGPAPLVRRSRIRGRAPDEAYPGPRAAIEALFAASAGLVNIRSFRPGRTKGNPFAYGVGKIDEAVARMEELATGGYVTIVNETIDTHDGGVSGVVLGGVIEFAPLDTPRGVESSGTASLPFPLGHALLTTVYGFPPQLDDRAGERLEFSIHPIRVGYRHGHTLLWEAERVTPVALQAAVHWPNRFSRFIGDKAYGLLVAHLLGLAVPATLVVPRHLAPFRFGRPTGSAERWMRTCPAVPQAGRYPTTYGWSDPYETLRRVDPEGTAIPSVLAQDGVDAAFSGASLPGDGGDYVEGVPGRGEEFMQGETPPVALPETVIRDVRAAAARARAVLGPVRLEFVHDGTRVWVVQLHLSAHRYLAGVISPGEPASGWLDFDPEAGLDRLAELIERARESGAGIRITAPVGLTSHVGDLLRKAAVPARLALGPAG